MRAQRLFAHGSASDRCAAFAASHCALRFGGPDLEAVMSPYAAISSSIWSLSSILRNSGVSGKAARLLN